jgi:riboflavin synthase alpha subunit
MAYVEQKIGLVVSSQARTKEPIINSISDTFQEKTWCACVTKGFLAVGGASFNIVNVTKGFLYQVLLGKISIL